jgi:hypothetical protein
MLFGLVEAKFRFTLFEIIHYDAMSKKLLSNFENNLIPRPRLSAAETGASEKCVY